MKIIGLDLSTKKYCVYLFTFPNNKHYCGYSSNIRNRWSNNGKNYEKCPLVYKAIQKYGWNNIKKEILYSFNNKEEALKKEKETIEKMDLLNPAKGYNLIPGGQNPPHGKRFLTPEGYKKLQENGKRLAQQVWKDDPQLKEKVIKRMKERDKEIAANMTEEERKIRYGAHNIGKKPPNSKAIYKIDLKTHQILKKYDSLRDAALDCGGSPNCGTNLSKVANGVRTSAYGFGWRWVNE